MLPHEVIRKAADLIRAGGLSQGSNARDAAGREVPLHVGGGNEGRAGINPAAVSFSIYGALAAAMAKNATNPTPIWVVVRDEARRTMEGKARAGGTNYVHPVILLNEDVDTTKESALLFLERCALLIEPRQGAVSNG